jgi:hypothetical protein
MALPIAYPAIQSHALPSYAMQYLQFANVVNVPVILLPSNSKRVAFCISNSNTTYPLMFSFGPPLYNGSTPMGGVVAAMVCYDTVGQYISIQDIWVWYGSASVSFPAVVTGFEFTPVPNARPA